MIQPLNSRLPALIVILLWAGALATGAFVINHAPQDGGGEAAGSVYILGPARGILAKALYVRADLYFHKGAPTSKEKAFDDFFQKWKRAIVPEVHAHTEGKEVEEILPWLRLATQSDPHNIEIYLVAAYWLNGECNRPDLAMQAIQEAVEKNPERYELPMEMGRLYIGLADFPNAITSLEHAENLLRTMEPNDLEQAAIDLPFILTSKSFLYEALSDRDNAVLATREYLKLKYTQPMADRLEMLEVGSLQPEEAMARLGLLFNKTHECDRDDHDHEGHIHDEHCDHSEHVHGPDCNH